VGFIPKEKATNTLRGGRKNLKKRGKKPNPIEICTEKRRPSQYQMANVAKRDPSKGCLNDPDHGRKNRSHRGKNRGKIRKGNRQGR